MEEGGLFDTPEYYKAALEQEQLENTSLRKIILELNKKLGTKEFIIDFLLESNSSQINQITKLQKRIDDLLAEKEELIFQKAQCDNELAARNEVELSFTNQMNLWITQLPVLSEFKKPKMSSLIGGSMPNWFNLIIAIFNEMIQRIKLLESAAIESKPTNNLHIEGDFVMNKEDSKENKE